MSSAQPSGSRLRATPFWVAVCVLLVAGAVLRWIDSQLSGLHRSGDLPFDSSAFTNWRWPPIDTTHLEDALASWTAEGVDTSRVGDLVTAYVVIDLIAFTPAYLVALWYALRWGTRAIGVPERLQQIVVRMTLVLLAVEVAEGAATLAVLTPWNWADAPSEIPLEQIADSMLDRPLWITTTLSTIKWVLVIALLLIVGFGVVEWARDRLRRSR